MILVMTTLGTRTFVVGAGAGLRTFFLGVASTFDALGSRPLWAGLSPAFGGFFITPFRA
jgi:hypothetical protein